MTKRAPVKTGRKQGKTPAPAKDPRRDPTESEQLVIDKAVSRLNKNLIDPPEIAGQLLGGALSLASPHNNDTGHAAALADSMGLSGAVLLNVIQTNLLNIRGRATPTTEAEAEEAARDVREGIAFVQALNPTSSQEAIMGVQMWATHCATMKLSRSLHHAEMLPQLTAYSQLMSKAQRTFTAQVETLQKLRTGGKQQVEVRYVYVDARTQTVVTGGGGEPGTLPQPHARLGYAPGLPVWGEDAGGDAMPIPCRQEPEAVPDARREKSRRAEGKGKRGVRPRPEKRRDKAA